MNKVLQFFSILLLITSPLINFSQTSKISKPALEIEGKSLIVKYDLNGDRDDIFDVSLELMNSNGENIDVKTLSGDIGENITSGLNKTIILDFSEFSEELQESVSVRVIAEILNKHYSKGGLLLRSAVWPGWGQSKLKKSRPYWLIGIVGYASAAGAVVYNQKSINSYNQYKNVQDIIESNELYDLAIQQKNTSDILLYSAIGVWVVNIIWTGLMPNNAMNSNKYVNFNIIPNYHGENTFVSIGFNVNL